MQQQLTGPIPPYQFKETRHIVMPLEQTIDRTPSTSNNKNNTQDEPEIRTNYTWQQAKKRKRCNQSPETTMEGNPFLFNTQNRYEELSQLSDEDMQTNETDETTTNTKNKPPRKSKPPPVYIYGVTNYREKVKHLATTIEEDQYYCKALSNETTKINVTTSESYRKLIRQLQQEK
jgi:hypothetical protein